MMLVILLAVQAAMWAQASEVVQSAAAIGSQAAAESSGSPDQGKQAAESYLQAHAASLVASPYVEVKSPASGYVSVRVSGSTESIVPLFNWGVSADRVEPIQEFRESG
jgi:hypothetical protein